MKREGVDTELLAERMGNKKLLNIYIDDLIVKTMISCQPELTHYYRTCQPSDLEGTM